MIGFGLRLFQKGTTYFCGCLGTLNTRDNPVTKSWASDAGCESLPSAGISTPTLRCTVGNHNSFGIKLGLAEKASQSAKITEFMERPVNLQPPT
jgi:hypothetical protein